MYNVLFLCRGNSARSIIAEAVLRSLDPQRFAAFSAGSHPHGVVQSLALDVLRLMDIATDGLRSKSWDEFTAPGAPTMDFVFTVCDRTARESCPVWPGQPVTAEWCVPDPMEVAGSAEDRTIAYFQALSVLGHRIETFIQLPLDDLEHAARVAAAHRVGTLTKVPPGSVWTQAHRRADPAARSGQ